jgi:hypothetical protein
MTRALVEGWKEEGQWPPQPTEPEPRGGGKFGFGGAGGRKEGGKERKESAFTRWRREHSRGNYLKVYDKEQRVLEKQQQKVEKERQDSLKRGSVDPSSPVVNTNLPGGEGTTDGISPSSSGFPETR